MGKDTQPKSKPKDTASEEYKRFLETAKAVEASDDKKDFDRAFAKIVTRSPPKK